jgi:hypothetical protein
LAKHPRVLLHFTLTSASWLNLVEMCFSRLDHQALRRGDVPNIDDLTAVIGRFCQSCNEHCQPFSWTEESVSLDAKRAFPFRIDGRR